MSFKDWLFLDKENQSLLKLSVIAIIIPFIWLKILYPFPNFMPPDSNYYLEAAQHNQFINIWATGYSKFLRFVSCFTNSALALVIIQYLILQGSLLYFLFTIRYFINPPKWVFRAILCLSVLNPLLPHISNFVSSDALFTSLSLIWLTHLICLLFRPAKRLLILHSVILLMTFMVRYNALYYPIISIAVILLSKVDVRGKVLGIGSILVLLTFFIQQTEVEYKRQTGFYQYTAFGGWQLAANALYGYAYATPIASSDVPIRMRKLHASVNRHMDSLRHLTARPDSEVAIYYLWDFKSPLKTYLTEQWNTDSTTGYFKKWASMAPLYASYGYFLIRHRPGSFLKYYALPNLIKYYVPPTKFMGVYNLHNETVDDIVVSWFRWKSNKVSTYRKNKTIPIAQSLSLISSIINIVFLLTYLGFLGIVGVRRGLTYCNGITGWISLIWLSNLVFSVLSAPIELRYQLFPTIIDLSFSILFIAFILQEGTANPLPRTQVNVSKVSLEVG